MAGAKGQHGGARENTGGKRHGAGRKPSAKTIFEREFVGPVIPKRTRRTFANDEDRKASRKNEYLKISDALKAKYENKRRLACEALGIEYEKYKTTTKHELVCKECGVLFIGKLINTKYCSAKCRVKAGNKIKSNKEKNDGLLRFKSIVRAAIRKCFIRNGYTKRSRTHEIFGCNWEFFRTHIEKQFLKGMDWSKIGSEIHIDHITPIATATTEEEVIALNHFTNLRPMWAKDNLKKNDQITHLI